MQMLPLGWSTLIHVRAHVDHEWSWIVAYYGHAREKKLNATIEYIWLWDALMICATCASVPLCKVAKSRSPRKSTAAMRRDGQRWITSWRWMCRRCGLAFDGNYLDILSFDILHQACSYFSIHWSSASRKAVHMECREVMNRSIYAWPSIWYCIICLSYDVLCLSYACPCILRTWLDWSSLVHLQLVIWIRILYYLIVCLATPLCWMRWSWSQHNVNNPARSRRWQKQRGLNGLRRVSHHRRYWPWAIHHNSSYGH